MAGTFIMKHLQGLEADSVVGAALSTWVSRLARGGLIDPVSSLICMRVRGALKLPVSLLALTMVRYSELKFIDIRALLSGFPFKVYQPKTREYREVWGQGPVIDGWELLPYENVDVGRFGYDAVCSCLSKAIPEEVSLRIWNRSDKTHIFRHLGASWAALNGWGNEIISAKLGHANPASNESYLHVEELRDILLKN